MSSLKQPPSFDPQGGDSYTDWKVDLDVWRLYTKEEKKRTGPAVYLCLQGDAREACRDIAKELATDDGVDKIVNALDAVYLKDETTRAFCALKSFVEFRRDGGQGYSKFFLEFNNRYREVKKYKLILPDGVLAYFLLTSANLSPDHERLVRATAKLEFEDVKDKLQKVFGEMGESEGDGVGTLPVNEENCFYLKSFNQKEYKNKNGGHRGGQRNYFQRGTFRGSNYRGGRGKAKNQGNPVDGDGHVLRCHCCESTKHFWNDCPHKKIEEGNMTVHITLVAGVSNNVMLIDTLGKGILDSACTKTVAGKTWIEEYLSLLSEKDRLNADKSSKEGASYFRFGDGKESKSTKVMKLPILVYGRRREIEVDIVDHNIPLLISKPSMSELGMVIDFSKHSLMIDGKVIKLQCNSAGHYVIPVSEWTNESCNVIFHAEQLQNQSKEEKKRKALKLHRQFAHATKEKLIELLKNGGCKDKEFIEEITKCCKTCEFCLKYRRPKPRPVVSLMKADRFNKVVAMDLKEVIKGELWILHLVDYATRYTAAALITSKKKDVVVGKILTIWLAYFGSPKRFHNDCGGEFCNDVFTELSERFGIEISTTPGEAPFGNGVVERGNTMLFESMMKTKEDAKCSFETALAWAVSAKNALQNTYGYSPNQLVFGSNVNLPTVDTDHLPALESTVKSDLVRENLNALHRARENFIKAESSERIRRALKHNVRTYSEIEFLPGDKVYYRRKATKDWRGPGKVLGKDNNFVLIRHGSAFYRCHPCHLLKEETSTQGMKKSGNISSNSQPTACKNTKIGVIDSDSESDDGENPGENPDDDDENPDENPDDENPGENPDDDDENPGENQDYENPGENPEDDENPGENPDNENTGENPYHDENPHGNVDYQNPGENPDDEKLGENPVNDENPGENPEERSENLTLAGTNIYGDDLEHENFENRNHDVVYIPHGICHEKGFEESLKDCKVILRKVVVSDDDGNTVLNTGENENIAEIGQSSHDSCQTEAEKLFNSSIRPDVNTSIQYMLEDGRVVKAQVLSCQPRRTGTGKWNWINVKVWGENEPSSVNWECVLWWRKIVGLDEVLVLSTTEECHQEIIDAKEKELHNLEENNVFEWTNDEGQKVVSCKWVIERKHESDGSVRLKARLVARGFEEQLVDKKIDSPTCSRQALRIVWITAATMKWDLYSLDISAAFLQGNEITREVYVRPPNDVGEDGKVWRLKRCLYGLNDAPREWYNRVKEELLKLGGTVSLYDQCLFLWHDNRKLIGILVTHVDDFEYAGTLIWHETVIGKIKKLFKISKMENGSFRYLGLNIKQNGDEIFVDQHSYVKEMKEIHIDEKRKCQLDEKLTDEEKKQLRSACGQLLWATSQTRPDVAFESCQLSNHGNDARVRSLINANKAIKKLKSASMNLVFPGLGDPNKIKVISYGDATHASLPSGASQGASIVFICGNNRVAPIAWRSKKLDRVTKSPLASEVSALADSTDSAHLAASMVKEVFALALLPKIESYTDSKSLVQHLESTKVIQDPRLRVDIARLREMVELGEVDVKWICGKKQLADCLTKRGASTDRLVKVLTCGCLPG